MAGSRVSSNVNNWNRTCDIPKHKPRDLYSKPSLTDALPEGFGEDVLELPDDGIIGFRGHRLHHLRGVLGGEAGEVAPAARPHLFAPEKETTNWYDSWVHPRNKA